ncbi:MULTISPECIES: hypothetical protein [unclassified Streptomyces]|uniref:hypothetical protein n=1 Tax=unclassified Streptomyces TaxID=2593676 RepID=UPI001CD6A2EA|nr:MULTISPECIES: hypothetical protein [unclassified Streptomyces]
MTTHSDDCTVWIGSVVDSEGKAACHLTWGPVQALLKPQVVLDTARDLAAAAAHAETDVALLGVLLDRLRVDLQTAGRLLFDVRALRTLPPTPSALRIEAVAGMKTGLPFVHIARGSMKAALTPVEAREMAGQWTQAAIAAQTDVRLRYALGEWDHLTPTQIEDLLQKMQELHR